MKISLKNSLLLVAVAMMSVVASCGDDDGASPSNNNNTNNNNNNTNNNNNNNTFEESYVASVDGTEIDFGVEITAAADGGKIVVVGTNMGSEKSITLTVLEDQAEGSFTLNGSNSNQVMNYSEDAGNKLFVVSSGALTIDKHDENAKTIEGAFQFDAIELTGVGTVSVTGGSFKAKYE